MRPCHWDTLGLKQRDYYLTGMHACMHACDLVATTLTYPWKTNVA